MGGAMIIITLAIGIGIFQWRDSDDVGFSAFAAFLTLFLGCVIWCVGSLVASCAAPVEIKSEELVYMVRIESDQDISPQYISSSKVSYNFLYKDDKIDVIKTDTISKKNAAISKIPDCIQPYVRKIKYRYSNPILRFTFSMYDFAINEPIYIFYVPDNSIQYRDEWVGNLVPAN